MSHHLKRLNTPRSWTVSRKTNVYTTKPSPGPHPIERAVPLSTVLRDYLGLAATGREARNAIGNGQILVDGRVIKNGKLPVGFQDVVSINGTDLAWRCVLDNKGRLRFSSLKKAESAWKLVQIKNKTTVKGGKTQLNLHDGRNLLVAQDDYKTGDVLKLELPSQTVLGHFKLEEDAKVLIVGGRHTGEIAPVNNIEITRSHKANLVHLKGEEGTFTTIKPYAFPVGDVANLPKVEVSVVA